MQSQGYHLQQCPDYLGYEMGGGDQINVMTPELILEIKHSPGQCAAICFVKLLSGGVLADLEVLAIDATHIAITEKNGT